MAYTRAEYLAMIADIDMALRKNRAMLQGLIEVGITPRKAAEIIRHTEDAWHATRKLADLVYLAVQDGAGLSADT